MSLTPNAISIFTQSRSLEIKALTDKTHMFDEEYTVIVAEQHTADHVQPHVLCEMLAYSPHMQAFESELATLDADQINVILTILGFPRS